MEEGDTVGARVSTLWLYTFLKNVNASISTRLNTRKREKERPIEDNLEGDGSPRPERTGAFYINHAS